MLSIAINNTIVNNLVNKITGLITTHNADTNAHSDKESKSNKVTSLSSSSTDTEYPSAKAAYDATHNVDEKYSVLYNLNIETDVDDDIYDADRWTESGSMSIGQTSSYKYIGSGVNGYVIYNGNISNLDNYDITLNLKANKTNTFVYINDNNIGTLPTSQTSILFKKRDGVVKVVYDNNQYNASTVKIIASSPTSMIKYTIDIVLYQGMIYDVIDSIPSKTSDLTNDNGFLTQHQDISGKEDSSNKVSSWNSTTNNIRYPTEKLVKDSLDAKANSTHNHTKSQITDFPTIPTKTSELTNDGDGNSNQYVLDDGVKTINNQSILGTGNISISGGGNVDFSLDTYSTNPVQNQAIANAFEKIVEDLDNVNSHYGVLFRLNDIYGTDELTGFGDLLVYSTDEDALFYAKTGNMNQDKIATIGDIPSLTNYVQKSSTAGLLKNDGTIMTSGTNASNFATGDHTHSTYVNPTICDNLTTNDATQVLSAKQGKVLNDKIGDIISIINGTGGNS